ncbi:hypothetical protein D3P06_14190 [Paracoccus aestuarii]|uniref:Uncharacterized protein n=2 Tax=Paracoccus aestuarii TaxID=453842 RepID=A0A418ZRY2_9RHOB|nr:hypothetical protein [Paracoccus aestuarii]RJK99778.1 hypothetical protein D3P06_14190 [Paracoccus aestuarii]WCR00181.1 hypothetical protein JHW48_05635 [Paracoccus aestuarii]
MRPPHDRHSRPTAADVTSQTRFGPRPVPQPDAKGVVRHAKGQPDRRIITDGRQSFVEPSTTAKVIVWGGVALGFAGLTAATAVVVRKLTGDDDEPRPTHRATPAAAPRFAQMDDDDREAMRRRVRAQAQDDARHAAQLRARASRGRRKGNTAQNLTRTATDLSQGLNGVAQSLVSAFQSFRGVSHQATSIVGEFVAAADQLRSILHGTPGPRPGAPEPRADAPRRPQ